MVQNSTKKFKEDVSIELDDNSFKNFRLRRIVKENHGSSISQLIMGLNSSEKFNGSEIKQENLTNLLLTVSQSQINIYDNEHYGDHLDLMCHFSLPSELKNNLYTCCWMKSEEDAIIAFAGSSGVIHLVSIAYSQEFARLEGHEGSITDVVRHPLEKSFLMSCSKDGTVRLWNIYTKKCLLKFKCKANALCFNPSGTSLFCGGYDGSIKEYSLPEPKFLFKSTDSEFAKLSKISHLVSNDHDNIVDCMTFSGNNLISKSSGGKIIVWDPISGEISLKIHVRHAASNSSRFGVSDDSRYICVGSSLGSIYVYSLTTGKLLTELRHRRSTKAISGCTFARRGRNIIGSNTEGIILRYDYITPETLEEWRKWEQNEK